MDNSTVALPYLGEKTFVLFYIDPDVQDVIDPLSEALDAKKYPTEKFGAIGVINCKDTWIPNAAILAKARQNQEKFPKSLVLLDKDHTLPKAWKLGECNGSAKILVVGKDEKIKYIQTITSKDECRAITNQVLNIIETELKK
jgi:predicted transcriptional regulator